MKQDEILIRLNQYKDAFNKRLPQIRQDIARKINAVRDLNSGAYYIEISKSFQYEHISTLQKIALYASEAASSPRLASKAVEIVAIEIENIAIYHFTETLNGKGSGYPLTGNGASQLSSEFHANVIRNGRNVVEDISNSIRFKNEGGILNFLKRNYWNIINTVLAASAILLSALSLMQDLQSATSTVTPTPLTPSNAVSNNHRTSAP